MSLHQPHQTNTCAAARPPGLESMREAGCSKQGQLLSTAEATLREAEQLLQLVMAAGIDHISRADLDKLCGLQEKLTAFKPLVDSAQLAAARCCWREAILQAQKCLLAIQHPETVPGLSVKVLMIKAEAANNLQSHDTALEALDLALQLQPGNAEALWKRAAVHAAAGNHHASFLDLKKLSNLQPTYPGILQALQHAARFCAEQRTAQTRVSAPEKRYSRIRRTQTLGGGAGCSNAGNEALQGGLKLQSAYCELDLSPDACDDDIKRGYKRLAAKYHPDKWMQASVEDRAAAEEKFKAVSAAYQALMGV